MNPLERNVCILGFLIVPMEALSKDAQLVPHWLCWVLWKSFMFKQAPYRAVEGDEAALGCAVPLQEVIAPNLE